MATRARKQTSQVLKQQENNGNGGKRQAENRSPGKVLKKPRTAFGDITNKENVKVGGKKQTKAGKKKEVVILPKTKKSSAITNSQPESQDVSWEVVELSQGSQGSNSSQSSVASDVESLNLKNLQLSQESSKPEKPKDQDWEDVDAENMHDPSQVALYANDIFSYYKKREVTFQLKDYMSSQLDLSPNMRAVLVDWLVEVQENFELNHETLYLAVKMVDHYLSKHTVMREKLQLVGATALFIACKFDERCPPVLDDFLYICDDAYMREDLIKMEQTLLRSMDFDLGLPLSYRFLRRYAKCARASMETLTLARFILEMSLMEYTLVKELDSKLASATLLLAHRMKNFTPWSPTLVHYTGYEEVDLMPIVHKLNDMISSSSHKNLTTIRAKYSHKVFYEVAKIPPLNLSQS